MQFTQEHAQLRETKPTMHYIELPAMLMAECEKDVTKHSSHTAAEDGS